MSMLYAYPNRQGCMGGGGQARLRTVLLIKILTVLNGEFGGRVNRGSRSASGTAGAFGTCGSTAAKGAAKGRACIGVTGLTRGAVICPSTTESPGGLRPPGPPPPPVHGVALGHSPNTTESPARGSAPRDPAPPPVHGVALGQSLTPPSPRGGSAPPDPPRLSMALH